jgi:hypothetical protein
MPLTSDSWLLANMKHVTIISTYTAAVMSKSSISIYVVVAPLPRK